MGGLAVPKAQMKRAEEEGSSAVGMMYVKEYVNVLCAADNPSMNGRLNAFMSLTMGGSGSGGGSNGGGGSKKVTVEYEVIAKRLRKEVLDNLVVDRWGPAGLRIVSILRNCGKLDGDQARALLSLI